MLKIRLYLDRHDVHSRALFDVLPMQLMGRSYCADYVLVEGDRASAVCNRLTCEQHLTGQVDALAGASGAVPFCGPTPAIEALGCVFNGENALDAFIQHLAHTPVELL